MPSPAVLVIDDEPTMRLCLQHLLRQAGYDVVLAQDSREARKCLPERQFRAVLLDMTLDGEDGFSLLETLRSDPHARDALIIVATASAKAATRQKAQALGADHCLVKPYSVANLRDALNRIGGGGHG